MNIRSLAVRFAGLVVVCAIARSTEVILTRPALNGTLPGGWEAAVLAAAGVWAAWSVMLQAYEWSDRIRDAGQADRRN